MTPRISIAALAGTLVLTVLAWPQAAEIIPTARPEDVGLSSERLGRINEMMQRRMAANENVGKIVLTVD